jgi:hypothetical protein
MTQHSTQTKTITHTHANADMLYPKNQARKHVSSKDLHRVYDSLPSDSWQVSFIRRRCVHAGSSTKSLSPSRQHPLIRYWLQH